MVEVGFQWWMAMTRSLGRNTANIYVCNQLILLLSSVYAQGIQCGYASSVPAVP